MSISKEHSTDQAKTIFLGALEIAVEAENLSRLGREAWPVHATLEGAGTRLEGTGELGPEVAVDRVHPLDGHHEAMPPPADMPAPQ